MCSIPCLFPVAALKSVKKSLVDPMKHLSSWKRGDPCASNWTGIFCLDTYATDGYLHVRELCVPFVLHFTFAVIDLSLSL